MTKTGEKRQRKTLIWVGLAIWLGSALLYALNDGPFKATPLQITGLIGFALFAFGCVQAWRRRERPTDN